MESINMTKEFTTKNFSAIDINNSYEKLINLLEENNFQSIFITEKKGNFIGFIALEQVLKEAKNNISLKKMVSKLSLLREFNIEQILDIYLAKDLLVVPIVDQKEKIVEAIDVFKVASEYLFDLDYKVEEIIEPIPFKITNNERLDQLKSEIKKSYLDNIVVETNGQITGFIKSKTLINLLKPEEGTSRGEKTGEKLRFEGTVENFIIDDNSIFINHQEIYNTNNLISLMEKNNSPLLYVKDEKDNLKGLIRLKRLINLAMNSKRMESSLPIITVLSAPDENIENISKKKILALIERHTDSFAKGQESEGTIRFHKIENQSQKGMFKYETDIRISFGKGKDSVFTVKSDDWGAEKSLNRAFSKISRLISDKRKISKNLYHKKGILEQEP